LQPEGVGDLPGGPPGLGAGFCGGGGGGGFCGGGGFATAGIGVG